MVGLDDLNNSVIQWFYVMCWEDGILVSQIMCFLPLDPFASSEPQGHGCLLLPFLQQPITAAILCLLGWVLCRLHEWKMYFALHPLAFFLTWGAYTFLCMGILWYTLPRHSQNRQTGPCYGRNGVPENQFCLPLRMERSWESFSLTFPFPQETLWFAVSSCQSWAILHWPQEKEQTCWAGHPFTILKPHLESCLGWLLIWLRACIGEYSRQLCLFFVCSDLGILLWPPRGMEQIHWQRECHDNKLRGTQRGVAFHPALPWWVCCASLLICMSVGNEGLSGKIFLPL